MADVSFADSAEEENVRALSQLTLALRPKPVSSVRIGEGINAALCIDQIKWVEVAESFKSNVDGTIVCTLNIFVKRDQYRLPAARLHQKAAKVLMNKMKKPLRTEPDFIVRRSICELQDLRKAIVTTTVEQSHIRFCHHCNAYQSLLLFNSTRLTILIAELCSLEKAVRVAEKLIRDLIEHFQSRQPGSGRREGCMAIRDVPLILHWFLFGGESERT